MLTLISWLYKQFIILDLVLKLWRSLNELEYDVCADFMGRYLTFLSIELVDHAQELSVQDQDDETDTLS